MIYFYFIIVIIIFVLTVFPNNLFFLLSNIFQNKGKEKDGETTPDTGGAGTPQEQDTIGLALTGGVFASAVVAGGIMRGFQKQKIIIDGEERPAMERFDYTAAISGANVAQVVYAYARDTTSDEILDADGINDPTLITTEILEDVPEKSLFSRLNIPVAPYAIIALIKLIFSGGIWWDILLFHLLLEPFGVMDGKPIGKTRDDVKATPIVMVSMIGPSEIYPQYITDMNHQFHENFKAVEHLMNSFDYLGNTLPTLPNNDIIWEVAKKSGFQFAYGAYMTPDEFVIPMLEHTAKYDTLDKNNNTIEPIDFMPVSSHIDQVQPESEGSFTLKKMLGAGTTFISINSGFAPFREYITPSTIDLQTADGGKRNMVITDGGYNDMNGIMALVQKKVRKIICNFYRTGENIDVEQLAALGPQIFPAFSWGPLASYFGGFFPETDPNSFVYMQSYSNHVFDLLSNGENQLIKYVEIANSLDNAGEPIIVTLKDLDVIENKFWGIEGGGKVDLTVIANFGVPKKFSDQISQNVAPPPAGRNFTENGFFTNEDFKKVPNIMPYSKEEVIPEIPELNFTGFNLSISPKVGTKEMRMTEILCSWMIEHAWEGLVGDDGEKKFGGFKEIFESSSN